MNCVDRLPVLGIPQTGYSGKIKIFTYPHLTTLAQFLKN